MQTVIDLGNRLLREQRYEDGIGVLMRNIELYPNQPESYWHVGDAYVLSGQPAKARSYLVTALEKARGRGAPDLEDYQESLDDLDAELSERRRDGSDY